jgi:transcriptional regulator with GAF, ATPase, and Fis domain
MRHATRKRRSTDLDREIAEVLAKKTGRRHGPSGGRHHATIRECGTWAPDATVEPLTEAKRLSAAEFERCYLVNLMRRAGSVSEGARLSGLDRTNFRRLLSRHGLRSRE